jgi:protein TonB
MTTPTTTRGYRTGDPIGGGIAGALVVHAAFGAMLFGWAWFSHSGKNWGSAAATAGAIQATMVSGLPLPPKVAPDPNNVLATDTPSPAPVAPQPKTVEVPHPDAVPIPTPLPKSPKLADRTTPTPPLHSPLTKVDPTKAQTGQASASIPQSSTQTHAGSFTVRTDDAAFGNRFAYYVNQITQKVAQQWYTGMLDPQATGHRVYITFQVERDGSLSHIQIAQRSGDNTLDQTALSAVQHIDTFPPLPEAYSGSHIEVTYYFDPPAQH